MRLDTFCPRAHPGAGCRPSEVTDLLPVLPVMLPAFALRNFSSDRAPDAPTATPASLT
jgi:hypothetical protein